MKKPELLAPVGNQESLVAAIEAGCDAVYLSGTMFGARKFAKNFNNEELKLAIEYAHKYKVKVYVTVNTLIYEEEVEEFLNYIDFLHKSNVDALIMQDIGMMDLVRKTYPNLSIHASTQMHIHNLEGTKFMENLGLERVVLARETSYEDIKKIKEKTNIELEIFIHGALCMCYSGQCLMSSLIGGRSGNRGSCTQCCRLPYDLISDNKKINKDKYLLSTKDLNSIDNLYKLLELNIDSLKIEGRMKSPEYVYQVVKIYRTIIDNYYLNKKTNIEEEIKKLQIIFNRKFTKGFLFNEENNNFINPYRPNHMGIEIGKVIDYKNGFAKILLSDNLSLLDGIRIIDKSDNGFIVTKMFKNRKEIKKAYKNDVIEIKVDKVNINSVVIKTKDNELINEINKEINSKKRKLILNGKIIIHQNKPIHLIVNLDDECIKLDGDIADTSINNPTTKEDVLKRLKKLGDTNFVFDNLDVEISDNTFVRIYSLNELRRNMVEKLYEILLKKSNYKKQTYSIKLNEYKEEPGYSVLVNNIEDYNNIKNKNIKYIYLNKELYNKIDDSRKVLKLDRVILNHEPNDKECLLGELGSVYYYKKGFTDYSLNVVNSYSVAFLNSIGIKRITLSYELNDYQIENIINEFKKRYNMLPNLELIVSSYPEVMITKFNLIKYFNLNGKNNYLRDTYNNLFKIIENDNGMTIKFYKKIILDSHQKYFDMGINTLRIHIEDKEDYKNI